MVMKANWCFYDCAFHKGREIFKYSLRQDLHFKATNPCYPLFNDPRTPPAPRGSFQRSNGENRVPRFKQPYAVPLGYCFVFNALGSDAPMRSAPSSTSALSSTSAPRVKGVRCTWKETLMARSPPAAIGLPDNLSPRLEARALPTPVKVRPFETLFDNYHDKEFIVNGFTRGFDLGFTGEPSL